MTGTKLLQNGLLFLDFDINKFTWVHSFHSNLHNIVNELN